MSFYNPNADKAVGQQVWTRRMFCGGTVHAYHTVKFDTAQTGETRATSCVEGAADGLFAGIALEDGVAGDYIDVAVKGYVEGVYTDGAVVAGETLVPAASGVLTHRQEAAVAGTAILPAVGVALEDDDATPVADIYLFGNVLP